MENRFLSLIESNELKYGCNPYQRVSKILYVDGNKNLPFTILNGNPGYINVLDAINSWYLVCEIEYSLGKIASASFKHVSPAGVAIGTNALEAYRYARDCDPRSSFGDFIAINTHVTIELAAFIKHKVSDGIIAPSYDEEALKILKSKKKNNYIILKGVRPNLNNQKYTEYKIIKNIAVSQENNSIIIRKNNFKNVVTKINKLDYQTIEDLIIGNITLKYTQSNSVCICYKGKTIGIGAGQQSRIDCVKLARRKAETYLLRSNEEVKKRLQFKSNVNYQQRINASIQYIENDMSDNERKLWETLFEIPPYFSINSGINRLEYFKTIEGISICSDGFFPFRDSIDQSSLINIKCVSQPGGSVADKSVIEACDEYGMSMVFTGIRLFHH